MIKNSTILAKCVFALALLSNASGSLAQTQAGGNTHDISTQDKKRLERFEKHVDELRARLKIPGMSAVVLNGSQVHLVQRLRSRNRESSCNAGPLYSPR